VVIAGANTGEIHAWKLNFAEIAAQNRNGAYTFLGTFKICKLARVQFAEFSPKSDLLMTGSTDGTVKVWNLDLPSNKGKEKSALKTFNMNDQSRMLLQIDEKNGC
jgi:WD40 repeat protein